MLAFDLETTSLDPKSGTITCAAAYDPENGVEAAFVFLLDGEPEEFMLLLDQADRLCAFNGVRFDLPFMQHSWNVPAERVDRWRRKLFDVFESCKLVLDVTFPLQALLELNGLAGKTGSGGDAIVLAREGRWDELKLYCMNDTRQTHAVSSLPEIRIPKAGWLVLRSSGQFMVV